MQEFVAIAGAEAQRQAEPDAEKRKYPGGAFDPLGLSKDSTVRPCLGNTCRPPPVARSDQFQNAEYAIDTPERHRCLFPCLHTTDIYSCSTPA